MDIVDAQAHIFMTIGVDETLAAMDALGIRSVLIDEVWHIDDVWHNFESPTQEGRVTPGAVLAGGVSRPMSPLADRITLLKSLQT